MKRYLSKFPRWLFAAGLLFSCAGTPRTALPVGGIAGRDDAGRPPPPEKPVEDPAGEPIPPEEKPEAPAMARARPEGLSRPPAPPSPPGLPEQRIIPETVPEDPARVPENILGRGRVGSSVMAGFLLNTNPGAGDFARNLAQYYVEEAAVEGVNHEVAFAQMCLETGFLRFGGLVTFDMNNFCGLGSIGPGQPGERFPDPRVGVRAHIQHLKVYATAEPLRQALVDPRNHYVRPGSSPSIKGLAGTWATDRQYAEKITGILERLHAFASGEQVPKGVPSLAAPPVEQKRPLPELSPADFISPITPP